MPLPNDLALRLGVSDLIAAYGDCIDDDRLEEWPEFSSTIATTSSPAVKATRRGCGMG